MHVLITGSNSYIGINLAKWLVKSNNSFIVDTISTLNNEWKLASFGIYDVVVHVAAIVHQKEKPKMREIYFRVNRDLAVQIALKSKKDGVKQFVFMSTMAVYGIDGAVFKEIIIDESTPCNPTSFYGKSKLEAEKELHKLQDNNFIVSIIRPPMIYGPNCPGNFQQLKKMILKLGIFPKTHNQRSMIYIDNLCEFIRILIEKGLNGTFCPQDEEFIDTYDLALNIAQLNGKRIRFIWIPKLILLFGSKLLPQINKAFGNLVYEKRISNYNFGTYNTVTFHNAIRNCEGSISNKLRSSIL